MNVGEALRTEQSLTSSIVNCSEEVFKKALLAVGMVARKEHQLRLELYTKSAQCMGFILAFEINFSLQEVSRRGLNGLADVFEVGV